MSGVAVSDVQVKPETPLVRGLGTRGSHSLKLSEYRLGVGPHWPWYLDPRPLEP